MDFHTLPRQTQKNRTGDKEVKYHKASLGRSKKESKETRRLSDNIKSFLAKKEDENRRKQFEEQKKKERLQWLRSLDSKSVRRVQSMLNRTKSANKSVIEDAKDNVNTSITIAGLNQPDEDDYGYVSKEATDIYNNLVDKYLNTPANTKIVNNKNYDISGTKDRVKTALSKAEEKHLLPRKRKPEDTESGSKELQQKKLKTDVGTENIKKRKPPPPLSFQELLKIAEKKQHEPIMVKKKESSIPLMTKKEKEIYFEEKRSEARRNAGRQDH